MAGNRTLEGKNAIIAGRMLRRVTRTLRRSGIPYILEAGTLLGIVRENRFLPWDNDLDITITGDYEKKLLSNLWRLWFSCYSVRVKHYHRDMKFFRKGETRIVKVSYRDPLKWFRKRVILDIFIKRLIDDQYYWTVGIMSPVLKSVPRRFYEQHTQIEFSGRKYMVPEDYTGYLEEHYGKEWRTPVKEWDFRTSDCSVREFL